MAGKGNPAAEFDAVLAGAWLELQAQVKRFMPGLRPAPALVPDKVASVLWVLGVAVEQFPSHHSDMLVRSRAVAFQRTGTAWLTLYGLKSRYEEQVYRGSDEQRAALRLAHEASQRLTRELLPQFRVAFDRTPQD